MPALVAGIHVLKAMQRFESNATFKDVDGRDKPGHDVGERVDSNKSWYSVGFFRRCSDADQRSEAVRRLNVTVETNTTAVPANR
jgi:hypothetical protein